jgi:O-6-methylguanine DNA methyltransferase
MNDPADTVIETLGRLAVDAPPTLHERVFARWVRVPGPIDDLLVAFTDVGIACVRPVSAVGDGEEIAAMCALELGRPLVAAVRTPAGLLDAVRTGDGRRLRYDLRSRTQFEQAVLRAALEIPRGEVRPYGWLAASIGRPRAVRAVGTALGHNPVPILIPCHRVVRSDGSIGQYGFGPAMKRQLLAREHVTLDGDRVRLRRVRR